MPEKERTHKMAKGSASAGGRAEAAGGGYEILVGAWYCVRILLGRVAHPLFDMPADTRLTALRSQSGEEVDDVNVRTNHDGVLFINVKRSIGLTTGEDSPLAKALDQFIRQYKSASEHTSEAVRGRGLDLARDRFVIATRSTAPGTVRLALTRLLRGLRDQNAKNLLSDITLNAEEREVAGVVETHLRRSWEEAYDHPATPAELGAVLRLIHLQFIDVEPGERERLSAMDDLRAHVLSEPTEADSVFSHLIAHCTRLRADQSGADTSTLLTALAQLGLHLQALPDFRADIAALRAWTTRRLATANRFTHLIDDEPTSLIERAAWPSLVQAAQQSSVLLVGDPGAGKSGLAFRLAQSELAAGRDVIFIPVDMLTVDGLAGLRAELGIAHDFAEILAHWPGAQPGLVVVDALDAARKFETQTALRVTIEDVLKRAAARWKVVASVRSYDLRQGTEWGRMFRGTPPAPEHSELQFKNVRHIAVARLTDDELAQMTRFSPVLGALHNAASSPLRALLRNIFNLRLLAGLVADGIVTSDLSAITTQTELLDLYWIRRIRRGDGNHDRREQALRVVVNSMLASRSLQTDRVDVVSQSEPAAVVDLEAHDILRAEDESGRNEDILLFTHHVLFDYAVARLVFRRGRDAANLVGRLVAEPALTLMLRPSLSLAFSEAWAAGEPDRPGFWNLAFALAQEPGIPAVGQVIGPMAIAEMAKGAEDFRALLDALRPGEQHQKAAELILQHMTGAILARMKTGVALVGPDAGPWMAFAEALGTIRTDAAMIALRALLQPATEKPADLTTGQLAAAGSAARDLLDFSWRRDPRIDQLVVAGINAVANTIASDPTATVALLRKALEPEHLRHFGYKELNWITRYVAAYSHHDLDFVVDLYAAAFEHEESSREEKTSMSNSAILGLTSNRGQDYEMAWWALGEAAPHLLDQHAVAGTRAVARSLAGYIARREANATNPATPVTFNFAGKVARYLRDHSYSWNAPGTRHVRDAPILIGKFDAFLELLVTRPQAQAVFAEVVATVIDERGEAVLWASLLHAAANYPALFSAAVMPLAKAEPVLGSFETRYQMGKFLTAAFAGFDRGDRCEIENAILSLSGPVSEITRKILAGCLDAAACETEAMKTFKAKLASNADVPGNRPSMQLTFGSRDYDTDAYLEDLGVDTSGQDSGAVRDLMRAVEGIPDAWDPIMSIDEALRRLDIIDPLVDRLIGLPEGQIDQKFFEHAVGIAAEAALRVANASYDVIQQPDVQVRLKRIFLFAKGSTYPPFSQDREDKFHSNASWGSPSARNAAAAGLMALIRPMNPVDANIRDAILVLARDPVCDVRMRIVQGLHFFRTSDPLWMWNEIERVVQDEYTRTVVGIAIQTLTHVAYQDIPRAILIAKLAFSRYEGQEGDGIDAVLQSAATLIMDIHFHSSNQEADAFYAGQLADPTPHAEALENWVHRYSSNLQVGDDKGSSEDLLRAKTIAFYTEAAATISNTLATIYTEYDLSKSGEWPADVLARAKALNAILDDMATCIYFASGEDKQAELSPAEKARRWRLYRELVPVLERLAECHVVHTAYYLVQALENFVPADPANVFRLVVKSVVSAAKLGYAFESLGADAVVRVVERYLADHRDVFSDEDRLNELMDLLNLFVDAGWPAAQSLTFRLAEIWR